MSPRIQDTVRTRELLGGCEGRRSVKNSTHRLKGYGDFIDGDLVPSCNKRKYVVSNNHFWVFGMDQVVIMNVFPRSIDDLHTENKNRDTSFPEHSFRLVTLARISSTSYIWSSEVLSLICS